MAGRQRQNSLAARHGTSDETDIDLQTGRANQRVQLIGFIASLPIDFGASLRPRGIIGIQLLECGQCVERPVPIVVDQGLLEYIDQRK